MRARMGSQRVGAALLVAAIGCGGEASIDLVIDEVSPAEGPRGGGQTVVITGSGFLAGGAAPNMVMIGGRLAPSVSGISDGEIRLVTPPGSAGGAVDVVVFNAIGYETAAGAYTYADAPAITAIEPASGSHRGGDAVTIRGSGFADIDAGSAEVTFGGVPATGVEVVSDGELRAKAPRGQPYRAVDVTVTNRRGIASQAGGYTYTLRGLLAALGSRNLQRQVGQLYAIDTEAGEVIVLGAPSGVAIHAMATAPDGRVLGYARTTNTIYEVDPASGEMTPLRELTGPPGASPFRLVDLEFRGDTLLGLEKSLSSIGTIDLETGVFTISGTPHTTHRSEGIGSDGRTIWFTGSVDNLFNLYTLDLSTGQLSVSIDQMALLRGHGTTYADGSLYLAENLFDDASNTHSRILRIDPAGGAAVKIVNVPGQLHAMTAAP